MECRQEMAEPIHDIIKIGKRIDIMPIKNKEETFNYRPVSLISIVC